MKNYFFIFEKTKEHNKQNTGMYSGRINLLSIIGTISF